MIGTDITDKRRIAAAYAKHGAAFSAKILHPAEQTALNTQKDPIRYLAMRWAAKEAFGKALGTGLRAPVLMPAIHITHDELGAPHFSYNQDIAALIQQLGYRTLHLSLSDESDYAIAFVLAEKSTTNGYIVD